MSKGSSSITVVLGFCGVCAIVAAILFVLDKAKVVEDVAGIGGIFLAIAVLIVILSIWWGSRGAG